MRRLGMEARAIIPTAPMTLMIVPLLALAIVAFKLTESISNSVMDSLGEVDSEAARALSATEAIVVLQGANAELVATLAQVSQIHQSALLGNDPAATGDVRAARARLTASSNALATSLTGLGRVREALASHPATAHAEVRRMMGFAERGATIVPRVVSLFVEANERTLGRLETGEPDAARANFLFEERARLEAVTHRVGRQVEVLENLARQVSAIEAGQVSDIIATASQRATSRLWIGAIAAALIIAVVVGLALRTVRRARAPKTVPQARR